MSTLSYIQPNGIAITVGYAGEGAQARATEALRSAVVHGALAAVVVDREGVVTSGGALVAPPPAVPAVPALDPSPGLVVVPEVPDRDQLRALMDYHGLPTDDETVDKYYKMNFPGLRGLIQAYTIMVGAKK